MTVKEDGEKINFQSFFSGSANVHSVERVLVGNGVTTHVHVLRRGQRGRGSAQLVHGRGREAAGEILQK